MIRTSYELNQHYHMIPTSEVVFIHLLRNELFVHSILIFIQFYRSYICFKIPFSYFLWFKSIRHDKPQIRFYCYGSLLLWDNVCIKCIFTNQLLVSRVWRSPFTSRPCDDNRSKAQFHFHHQTHGLSKSFISFTFLAHVWTAW